MERIKVTYDGNMRTASNCANSQITLRTDNSPESCAAGADYSPVDMLISSYGACMLSMMGYMAAKKGFSVDGATVSMDYTQDEATHAIATIKAILRFPGLSFSEAEKKLLQGVAKACPVGASLNAGIKKELLFEF